MYDNSTYLLLLYLVHHIFSMLAGEILKSMRLLSVSHGELDYFLLVLRTNQKLAVLMSSVDTAYLISHVGSTSTHGGRYDNYREEYLAVVQAPGPRSKTLAESAEQHSQPARIRAAYHTVAMASRSSFFVKRSRRMASSL